MAVVLCGGLARQDGSSKARRRARGLVVMAGEDAHQMGDGRKAFGRHAELARAGNEDALAIGSVARAGRFALRRHLNQPLLARLVAGNEAAGLELLDGIGGEMGVLDTEDEADIGEALGPRAMGDRMEDEDLGGGQAGIAGRRHAADHPAIEGVAGKDEAEFDL